GVHRVDLHGTLTGDDWKLVPTLNGRDAFSAASFTTTAPGIVDRAAVLFRAADVALVVVLLGAWMLSVAWAYRASPALLAWCAASAAVLAAVGATGRFERVAVVLLAGAVLVPVAEPHRNLRGALLLVGVPWLALIAARSLPQIAHITAYSND